MGTVGLAVGLYAAFSDRKALSRVTCGSALAIAALSAIYALDFIFARTVGVPLNSPIYFGSLHVPILALYAIAFLCCLVEAVLYVPGLKRPKSF